MAGGSGSRGSAAANSSASTAAAAWQRTQRIGGPEAAEPDRLSAWQTGQDNATTAMGTDLQQRSPAGRRGGATLRRSNFRTLKSSKVSVENAASTLCGATWLKHSTEFRSGLKHYAA